MTTQEFLEMVMRESMTMPETTKDQAIAILSGTLPGMSPAVPDRTELDTMHDAFVYCLVTQYNTSIAPHISIIARMLSSNMFRKYKAVLIEGMDIIEGVLYEASRLVVPATGSEEAQKIHLARLLVRYALLYVVNRKPGHVALGVQIVTNIMCPTWGEGSSRTWKEAVENQMPTLIHGDEDVRRLVLTNWMNPATPALVGAELPDSES